MVRDKQVFLQVQKRIMVAQLESANLTLNFQAPLGWMGMMPGNWSCHTFPGNSRIRVLNGVNVKIITKGTNSSRCQKRQPDFRWL